MRAWDDYHKRSIRVVLEQEFVSRDAALLNPGAAADYDVLGRQHLNDRPLLTVGYEESSSACVPRQIEKTHAGVFAVEEICVANSLAFVANKDKVLGVHTMHFLKLVELSVRREE